MAERRDDGLHRYVPPVALGDHLSINARRTPEQACMVLEDGTTFTFLDVERRVNQLVRALADLGVRRGDRIAVLATDRHQYVELVCAAARGGFTYVPLNYRLALPEIRLLLERSEPVVLAVSEEYVGMAAELVAAVPSLRTVVGFDGGASGALGYEELISGQSTELARADTSDQDVLSIAFTSGTTALPKGVVQSQGMLQAMLHAILIEGHLTPEDFRYSAAPLFHISGIAIPLSGLVLGHPSLILRQFDPTTVMRWLQERAVTVAFMVPTMISMVLDQPGVADARYPHLRLLQYGASPMPPTLLKRAMETFGCEFSQAFGAGTEAGLQATLTPADHRRALAGDEHLLGSIGKPAFGVDLRVCDPEQEELVDVPRGAVGEIVTRSNSIMNGYYKMPEETRRVMRDGWFRGGDLARQDDEGYLYLAGRAKDMIIRGGENVYPIEIETVLFEFPGVREVAVIGEPDDRWGEVVRAVIAVDGSPPDEDQLRAFCRERLAAYKIPSSFELRRELPKNASGKVLKRVLREEAAGGAVGAARAH